MVADKYINISKIDWYEDLFMKGVDHSGVWVRYRDVEKILREAPAENVVEVVYCRDCRDWNGNRCSSILGLAAAKPSDYCARGKRCSDDA